MAISTLDILTAEVNGTDVTVEYKGKLYTLPHINTFYKGFVFKSVYTRVDFNNWKKDLILLTDNPRLIKELQMGSISAINNFIDDWFVVCGYDRKKVFNTSYVINIAAEGLEIDLRRIGIRGIKELIFSTNTISEIINIVNVFITGLEFITFQLINKFDNIGWTWEANIAADLFDLKNMELSANSSEGKGKPPSYKPEPHPRGYKVKHAAITAETIKTDLRQIEMKKILAALSGEVNEYSTQKYEQDVADKQATIRAKRQ